MATYTGADKAIDYLFTASNNTTAEYDNTATYAVGDFVIYSGVLYKCTSAISIPEDWTPAHWTQTTIMENAGGGGGGGTTVIANPAGAATDTLNKLQVGSTIYDVPSGGGSSGHTWSETEHIVGTWIDGKTVYEITIKKTGLGRVTTSTIMILRSEMPANISELLSIDTTYIDSSGAVWTQNTYINNQSMMITWLAGSGPDIYRWTQWGSGPTSMTAYCTLRYTKTS